MTKTNVVEFFSGNPVIKVKVKSKVTTGLPRKNPTTFVLVIFSVMHISQVIQPSRNFWHILYIYLRTNSMIMGDLTTTPARAALDFSCPPKMHNIIEISKLRKNNEQYWCVCNYVIFLYRLWLFVNIWKNSYEFSK